jgi:hypothetical protein
MKPTVRRVQISSELFWGFHEEIDLLLFESQQDVCNYMKRTLKDFFKTHNLLGLAEKVDMIQLHMHNQGKTIQDILRYTGRTDIVYVCDHNCS